MIYRRGGVNPALRIVAGVVLALPMASQAMAAQSYACSFTQECVGDDRPCDATDDMTMVFSRDESGWAIKTGEGEIMPFTPLAGKSSDMQSFLSDKIDPDAAALSILSIFSDGQAFMSTHGIFLSPGTVTHIGTCLQEGT